MAMVLEEFCADRRDLNYSILAPISAPMCWNTARAASTHGSDDPAGPPLRLQRKYVMVAKKAAPRSADLGRAAQQGRLCRMNLMDDSYPVGGGCT
jgi:chemotaxis protein methyltransferase CheR